MTDVPGYGGGWDAGANLGYFSGGGFGPLGPGYPGGLWINLGTAPVAPPPTLPPPTLPPPISPPVTTTPPPTATPPPPPPFTPQGPPASPPPPTIYEDAARQSRADSRVRQLGRPIIEGERAPRGAIGVGALGSLARIFGALGGVLWPSPMASGEPTAEEVERMIREQQRREREAETFEIETRRVPQPAIPPPPAPRVTPRPLPAPPRPSLPLPPPPAPRSSTPPRTAPRSQTNTPPTPATPPWALIGSILGSQIVPRGRLTVPRARVWSQPVTPTASSPLAPPSTVTSSPPSTVTSSPPLTSTPSPTANPLTGVQPSVLSSAPPNMRTRQRQRECRCDPKPKRKKQRECRARAPVRWAGGPKNGQLAGSRCISWRDLTKGA